MTPLPIADWQASLDEMEAALGATLSTLDRYQEGWASLLAEQRPAPGEAADRAGLEERLQEWDARLAAAAELAAAVERELNDREAAVWRWQELFTGWRDRIQQGAETRPLS